MHDNYEQRKWLMIQWREMSNLKDGLIVDIWNEIYFLKFHTKFLLWMGDCKCNYYSAVPLKHGQLSQNYPQQEHGIARSWKRGMGWLCEFIYLYIVHSRCCCAIWHIYDYVIKWKHFPSYWPFVRGIHRSLVNSPHTQSQWRGALMFSLICVWINGRVNSCEAGDLRRHRAHYDVIVMVIRHIVIRRPGSINHTIMISMNR